MAFDMFLEFPSAAPGNIKPVGDSQDPQHKAAIDIQAFALGIQNQITIGTRAPTRATFDSLQLSKGVDSATPPLCTLVGVQQPLPEALLYVRKADATKDYLVYHFKLVFVKDVKWSGGNADDLPKETVELVFGAMQVSYDQPQSSVAPERTIVATWNQVNNNDVFNVTGG